MSATVTFVGTTIHDDNVYVRPVRGGGYGVFIQILHVPSNTDVRITQGPYDYQGALKVAYANSPAHRRVGVRIRANGTPYAVSA